MIPQTDNNIILEAENVSKQFGGITALKDYNLRLQKKELLGLIGPNGAGKTTVFNILSGLFPPTTGNIYFNGSCITNLKPHQTSSLGIARTFQNIRVFEELTVIDNIKVAFHLHHGKGVLPTLFSLPSFTRSEMEIHFKSLEILNLFHLESMKDELTKNLSYGDQRRVELARAIASDPRLLLLDEPTAGLNPQETAQMVDLISYIHQKQNLTTILVEHDMKVIMGVCKRIQVLDQGMVIASGTPEQIKNNKKVVEAYLGKTRVR